MKKHILLVAVVSILILPAVSHAAYLIHLGNGGQFVTPLYWEEDREIRFYIGGGVMGVEKSIVTKIERFHFVDDSAYIVKPQQIPRNMGQPSESMLRGTTDIEETDRPVSEKNKDRIKVERNGLKETQQEANPSEDPKDKKKAGDAVGQAPVPIGKKNDSSKILR